MPPPDYTGFLKVAYDWQTLITGAAAFIGGLVAYAAGRIQASATREAADRQLAALARKQHAFGRLEIGQLSDDLFAVGIETRQPLAELHLLCGDLIHGRRCWGPHGDLQRFQIDCYRSTYRKSNTGIANLQ